MLSARQKPRPFSFLSVQYLRLQQLLLSKFYRKSYAEIQPSPSDDFIDIVLDARYSKDGKVIDIR